MTRNATHAAPPIPRFRPDDTAADRVAADRVARLNVAWGLFLMFYPLATLLIALVLSGFHARRLSIFVSITAWSPAAVQIGTMLYWKRYWKRRGWPGGCTCPLRIIERSLRRGTPCPRAAVVQPLVTLALVALLTALAGWRLMGAPPGAPTSPSASSPPTHANGDVRGPKGTP